ncbi:MAG: PAS domain S-box protein [bacterium]
MHDDPEREERLEETRRLREELPEAGDGARHDSGEAEPWFRSALDHYPYASVLYDPDLRIRFINRAGVVKSGLSREQIVGRCDDELLPPEVTGTYLPYLHLCLETRTPQTFESTHTLPSGTTTVVVSYVPLMDDRGQIQRILGITHDVTERKRAEEALELVARKYSTLIDTTSDGVWVQNLQGEILEVNDAYCRMSGYSRAELTRMPISTLEASESPEEVARHIRKVLEGGGHDRFESRHRRKDGTLFDVEITALYLHIEEGRIGVFVRDMTERKRVEEALRESEERFRVMADGSPMILWVSDAEGGNQFVNRTYCEFLGVTREQALGGQWQPFVHPSDLPEYVGTFLRSMQERKPFEAEARMRRADGQWRWIASHGEPRFSPGGEFLGYVGISPDITEQKRAEEELCRSRDELEVRVRERTAELGKVNEELRHLSAQLLTSLENERRFLAKEIHDSIGQILAAVKFRVELALFQAGKGRNRTRLKSLEDVIPTIQKSMEEVRRVQMSLRPSVLDDFGLVAAIRWFCREYRVTFPRLQLETELQIMEGDVSEPLKIAIYRIMQEAMNNVGKHSTASRVRLRLAKADGGIELIIQDDGEGFDVPKAMTVGPFGRGLGLTSMRERAELTDGRLTVESAVGRGTTIRAVWPLK